ncbi:MAG: hypothetical protein QM689_06510 [Oscillospiraceae bacterium]
MPQLLLEMVFMGFQTDDYLKKALLDTQERVRDFMHYSEKFSAGELKSFFSDYAKSESLQAQKLQALIDRT